MKKWVLVALICLLFFVESQVMAESATGNVLKENDSLETYTLEDQHGVLRTLQKDTEKVIVSFDMKLSKTFHKWLEERESTYLMDNKTEYIIDITGMPSIITWLFAGPKMRKYGFRILLIKEGNFGDKFPKEEGTFTVIKLDQEHNVTNISFPNNIDTIKNSIE